MDFRFTHIAALAKVMHSHSSSLFSKAQSMRVDHYLVLLKRAAVQRLSVLN